MAEFCLDCWNKINDLQVPKERYKLSREDELCEGCGKWKRVVVGIRRESWFSKVFFPWLKR